MAGSIAVPNGHGGGNEQKKVYLMLLLLGGLLIGTVIWWVSRQAVKVDSSGGCRAVIIDDEEWGDILSIALRSLGCTTEVYYDCDDIVFRHSTTVYFVDQYGHQNGLDYCIPKILRKHIRPIILMSASNLNHVRLPEHVAFMMKNGDIVAWAKMALGIAADLMMP